MRLRSDESRIMANFRPSYEGMSTLAHELGHAYHNLNLAEATAFQRDTPMTLAETASTFCENIVAQAAMRDAGVREKLAILENSLQRITQEVIDISSRFLFEQRVFELRRRRDLGISEFNELMLQAQRETYGDGLDENVLHPYMWCVKGHYYSVSRPYYNFPYMFGALFGLGLFRRYQTDSDGFRAGYDALLASTGKEAPDALAGRFGIDIRNRSFWESSLDIVRAEVDEFERLVEQVR